MAVIKDERAYELAVEYLRANPVVFQNGKATIPEKVEEFARIYREFEKALETTKFD